MKILVAVKRVIDYNVKVRVKADNSGVETANVKMSMNPFDEIAVEEAVRIREAGMASDIVAVSIGAAGCADTLRAALALGAERAIHIKTDEEVQPLGVAKLLVAVIEHETPDLILLGKQAIDDDCNQTGQMVAAMLGLPQATFASKIKLNPDDGSAEIEREIDGGMETIGLRMPAVITVDLRLNEPRYATLPNIMKARKKIIDTVPVGDFDVDIKPRLITLKVEEPPRRQAGVIVGSVSELVDKLKNEAKVI